MPALNSESNILPEIARIATPHGRKPCLLLVTTHDRKARVYPELRYLARITAGSRKVYSTVKVYQVDNSVRRPAELSDYSYLLC